MLSQPRVADWAEYGDNIRRNEDSPPGYFFLVRAWSSLAGISEVGLRSLSALLGLLATLLFFGLARQLLPPRAAIAAAGLYAIHPFLIEIAREARPYSLLICLSTASLWLLFRIAAGQAGLTSRLVFVAVTAALLYTHYFALLFISAEALALAIVWRRPSGLALFGAAGLLFLPGGLEMVRRAGDIGSGQRHIWVKVADSDWSLGAWLQAGLALPKKLLVGGVFIPDSWLGRGVLLALGLLVLVILAVAWRAWFRRDRRQALTLAILLVAPVLATLVLDAAIGMRTIQTPRYLAFLTLPYLLLFAAAFVPETPGHRLRWSLLILVPALFWANFQHFREGKHGFNWAEQVRQMEQFTGPDGVILAEYFRDPLLVGWYLKTPRQVICGIQSPPFTRVKVLPPGTKLAYIPSGGLIWTGNPDRPIHHRLTRLVGDKVLLPRRTVTVNSRYRTVLYFQRHPSSDSLREGR